MLETRVCCNDINPRDWSVVSVGKSSFSSLSLLYYQQLTTFYFIFITKLPGIIRPPGWFILYQPRIWILIDHCPNWSGKKPCRPSLAQQYPYLSSKFSKFFVFCRHWKETEHLHISCDCFLFYFLYRIKPNNNKLP